METSEEVVIGLIGLAAVYFGYQYYQNNIATPTASSTATPPVNSALAQALVSALAPATTAPVAVNSSVAPITVVSIPSTIGPSGYLSSYLANTPIANQAADSKLAANVTQNDIEASAYDVMQTYRTGNLVLRSVGTWNAARANYAASHGNVSVKLATGDPYGFGQSSINSADYHGWLRYVGAE